MADVKIFAPWVTFAKRVEGMFAKDPDVDVKWNDDERVITLFVKGADKADALAQILPEQKAFGNVTVSIKVVPANDELSVGELYRRAFTGNEAVSFIWTCPGPIQDGAVYVVFEPEIMQYFNDDLSDVNGNESILYEDVARRIFGKMDGVYFCTDIVDPELAKLAKPLGTWP